MNVKEASPIRNKRGKRIVLVVEQSRIRLQHVDEASDGNS